MAELQQLEPLINGGTATAAAAVATSSDNHHHHHHHHVASLGLGLTSKRQRRPSVRLGEIGDQSAALSYDSLRRTKQWGDSSKLRLPFQSKSSKTRALMNLSNGDGVESSEIEDVRVSGGAGDVVGGLDLLGIGSRKGRRGGMGTKRVRSNWAMNSKAEDGGIGVGDEKFSGEEGGNEGFRDSDPEGSGSPVKDQSPVQSTENPTMTATVELRQNLDRGHGNERELGFSGQRRGVRARVSDSRDHDGIELDGPSDTEARDWKCGTSVDRNGGVVEKVRPWPLGEGIRMWLEGLGLGRYSPFFEIHEVDEEVLPMLTLEDLKDMGIHAVGSRRKLYCAIQKLAKGFS